MPRSGGMFKDFYFNQRVKAAPYQASRIRYWDRAATQDGGCYTAGILMAQDAQGNYFVEHVVHGQWEPDERNERMRATALRDRTRYGPSYVPAIWVEAEGGSSGRDAYKGVARALAGFPVREDKVTGQKEVRAEPWSCQLAAKNVYLVEDGTWDINSYVAEHCAFPLGKYCDQVDSSSGAFNLLANVRSPGTLYVYGGGRSKRQQTLPRIVVCSKEELANLVIEQRTLLISICDPDKEQPGTEPTRMEQSGVFPNGTGQHLPSRSMPRHNLSQLLDFRALAFADLDPAEHQERIRDGQTSWDDLIEPFDQPIEKLIMTREIGKKFWSVLLRKREPTWEVLVLQDDGDRRALSLAYAVCKLLPLDRTRAIFRPANPAWQPRREEAPPNQHVFEVAKRSRVMVV
jgi:predicted phage terminase large subunit-like protein